MTGNLFIIAAPSGAGKTSLVHALVQNVANLQVSVSHTTRAQRPGEIEGVDYNFVSQPEFLQLIQDNKFLEHATVFGNYYGTSQAWVEATLARGVDVVLEIDWQGAQIIKALFPDTVSIYILPPSLSALEERLKKRAQDKAEIIATRMAQAQAELAHIHEYDFIVVNDQFDRAVGDLTAITRAARLRYHQQMKQQAGLLRALLES
jgi:guanylate kinase